MRVSISGEEYEVTGANPSVTEARAVWAYRDGLEGLDLRRRFEIDVGRVLELDDKLEFEKVSEPPSRQTSLEDIEDDEGVSPQDKVSEPHIRGAKITDYDLEELEDEWLLWDDEKLHIKSGYDKTVCGRESDDVQKGYDDFEDLCKQCLVRVHIDRGNQNLRSGESQKVVSYILKKYQVLQEED